jgi:hypothetical protein
MSRNRMLTRRVSVVAAYFMRCPGFSVELNLTIFATSIRSPPIRPPSQPVPCGQLLRRQSALVAGRNTHSNELTKTWLEP